MNEITNIQLENEMDLILAHKQSMRLAELTGLPLSAQTTFATAVSEVSRSAIGKDNHAFLKLYVSSKAEKVKFITAVLEDVRQDFSASKDEGYAYAKRLLPNIAATTNGNVNVIELNYRLPQTIRINDTLVEKWRINLNTDPAVSPYEEIKRKNRQLVEMADRLRESEQQYKQLTDSLPVMIFSMTDDGVMTYANKWLYDYSGQTIEEINNTAWQSLLHTDDLDKPWIDWNDKLHNSEAILVRERRVKNIRTGEYRWHNAISIGVPTDDGNIGMWNTFMVDIHAQKLVEQAMIDNKELKHAQAELEEKIVQLNRSNEQLEQFAYIASHDLQEPLRKISFYSDFLQKKHGQNLPQEAKGYFNILLGAADRMKVLIQDILTYSMVRKETFSEIDLNEIAAQAVYDLEIAIKEKNAAITISNLPTIEGNQLQLKQLFENLISNAIKFSRVGQSPYITITAELDDETVVLSFADNGIGFDQVYVQKMFTLFQRLHTRDAYSGTGIGLAICKKIADLHNGAISATGVPGEGATFSVSLPIKQFTLQDNTLA